MKTPPDVHPGDRVLAESLTRPLKRRTTTALVPGYRIPGVDLS